MESYGQIQVSRSIFIERRMTSDVTEEERFVPEIGESPYIVIVEA